MQLKSRELYSHLSSNLHLSYLLHGSEPLLIEDSVNLLRATAREAGYLERIVFTVEAGFDWTQFAGEFDSLSLFSDKKLIELRLPGGKPGIKGGEVLVQLAGRQQDNTLLFVLCGKMEAASKNSKWFKEFSRNAVSIEHYAVAANQLVDWIKQRAGSYRLQVDHQACRLLAYYLEGNLLAIDQELKKYSLLDNSQQINAQDIQKSVEDSARFSIYSFVDTALAGQVNRALRMLRSLQSEGVDPVLINWALARETRQLLQISEQINQGASIPASLKKHRVWSNRAGIVESALKRLKLSQWQSIHRRLARLDRIIKGRERSQAGCDVWTEYEQIILSLC